MCVMLRNMLLHALQITPQLSDPLLPSPSFNDDHMSGLCFACFPKDAASDGDQSIMRWRLAAMRDMEGLIMSDEGVVLDRIAQGNFNRLIRAYTR